MPEQIEQMKVAIFDMDGTLIDSMNEWRKQNIAFVHSRGIALTPKQEKELFSMTGMLVADYVREHFGIDADFDALVCSAVKRMEKVYLAGVPLKPGALAYLRRLRARGVRCVVCTATPSNQALIALNRTGLVPELDAITTTDMLGGSKGDPAFFDRLCAFLGADKAECVMFEDAVYAMRGARAAGLGVVGITDPTNEPDREAMHAVCDRVIASYDELP